MLTENDTKTQESNMKLIYVCEHCGVRVLRVGSDNDCPNCHEILRVDIDQDLHAEGGQIDN